MGRKPLNLDQDLLYNLYIRQKKSATQIGKILNCDRTTALYYLHKYNISTRPTGSQPLNLGQDLLYNLYIRQGKGTCEIGKKLNCGKTTVLSSLHKYGIPIRPPTKKLNFSRSLLHNLYIKQMRSTRQVGKVLNCTQFTVLRYLRKYNIPVRLKWPQLLNLNQDLLYDLYTKQKKSAYKIGKILNCSSGAIRKCLHKYNIPTRRKEHQRSDPIGITGIGEQVLLGSLLGDGSLSHQYKTPHYSETHGIAQKDYLRWKQKFLPFKTKYSESPKENSACQIWSGCHPEFEEYHTLKDKEELQKILSKLNTFGLIVWYLDDGSYNYRNGTIVIYRKKASLRHQQQYPIVKKWFQEKYAVTPNLAVTGFYFSTNDSKKIMKKFQPCISQLPRTIIYKFGMDEKRKKDAEKKVRLYRQRPEVKKRRKEYYQRPEVREREKTRRKTLKYKEWYKKYKQRPEVEKRMKKYGKRYRRRPEAKRRRKEYIKKYTKEYGKQYRQRPEVKKKRKKYYKEYRQRREVKARRVEQATKHQERLKYKKMTGGHRTSNPKIRNNKGSVNNELTSSNKV